MAYLSDVISKNREGFDVIRCRKVYFLGAHRYSYSVLRKTKYIFGDEKLGKRNAKLRMLAFWAVVAIFFVLPMISFSMDLLVARVRNGTHDVNVIDRLEVLSDAEEFSLISGMEDFYNQTHCSVTLITVSDEEWMRFDSFEEYTSNVYTDFFKKDQTRLLVVLSIDTNDNWCLTEKLGGSAGTALNKIVKKTFNNSQTSFEKEVQIGDKIIKTMSLLNENTRNYHLDALQWFGYAIVVLGRLGVTIIVLMCFRFTRFDPFGIKLIDSPVTVCPNCNHKCYSDSLNECPVCRTPLQGCISDDLRS